MNQLDKLQSMATNLRKQGKTESQIKQMITLYLKKTKGKTNPTGDLDIV